MKRAKHIKIGFKRFSPWKCKPITMGECVIEYYQWAMSGAVIGYM